MRRMTAFAVFAGALCVAGTPMLAADGVLLVHKTTVNGGAPQTFQMQIESRRMRAESGTPSGGKQIVLFDGAAQVIRIVDDARKTYMEMTKADMEAMADQMAGAMSQLQSQLANLPPEQRARVEAMMKGRGMPGGRGAAPKKIEYRKAGTDTVGKWKCTKYEGYSDGQKTSEICTVDPDALGFTAKDFAITREMQMFFSKIATSASQMFSFGTPETEGFAGVPIRSKANIAGTEIVTELSEASRQSFADASYQVPAGYQKQSMGMGGRRGRQ